MVSMRIDISPGNSSWEAAEKLLDIVWPDDVVATLAWRDVEWAHADQRVMVREDARRTRSSATWASLRARGPLE